MTRVRVFLSFDLENDEDLHDLMLEQSASANSGFEISARSEGGAMSDRWSTMVRGQMADTDEVVVICGQFRMTGVCGLWVAA